MTMIARNDKRLSLASFRTISFLLTKSFKTLLKIAMPPPNTAHSKLCKEQTLSVKTTHGGSPWG